MIHFDNDLVEKVLEVIKESRELSDVAADLNKIKYVHSSVRSIENIKKAGELDSVLRRKYPAIEKMLKIADSLSTYFANSSTEAQDIPEFERLRQDYYGILCHTLLEKQIITSMEQFFKKID